MKTRLLFDERPFDISFEAKVISCENGAVVLDETLFFPEQGGQTSDVGTLAGIKVTDVQIKDGVIYHYLEEPIAEGQSVKGQIDWNHRFNNMQQHTGEHIFTGLAHNKYGAENVGFHLSDNTVTLDLNIDLTKSQILELELEANKVIASDVPVKCWYPDQDELATILYRSKKEIQGAVRLVEVSGVDVCACCAPHVATTGQVGMLKVVSFEKYKGGVRVYILCGLRALADYNRRMEIIGEAYRALNCQEDDIPNKIKSLIEDSKQSKFKLTEYKSKMLLEQLEKYPSELADVTVFGEDLDSKTMRDGVNSLMQKHTGLCSIFSGNDEDGYSFVMGSQNRDCAAIAAGLRELLGAKCGGSKQMAQGSVMATRAQIEYTM